MGPVVFSMATCTKSLSVIGVEHLIEQRRENFDSMLLVVGVFRWLAAALTRAARPFEHLFSPCLPPGISQQSLVNDGQQALALWPQVARMIRAAQILAHPVALAGCRAEVMFRSAVDARRRPANHLPALVAFDVCNTRVLTAPAFLAAFTRAIDAGLAIFTWLKAHSTYWTEPLIHGDTSIHTVTSITRKGL